MSSFGQNQGYIDDLYRRYRADPATVSEAWREFFKDYGSAPDSGMPNDSRAAPPTAPPERTPSPDTAAEPAGTAATRLSGVAGRIAQNITSSLALPSATSARTIPVKIL